MMTTTKQYLVPVCAATWLVAAGLAGCAGDEEPIQARDVLLDVNGQSVSLRMEAPEVTEDTLTMEGVLDGESFIATLRIHEEGTFLEIENRELGRTLWMDGTPSGDLEYGIAELDDDGAPIENYVTIPEDSRLEASTEVLR